MKFQNLCSVCMCFKLQSPFRNEANTVIIHIASFYYKSQENKVRRRQLSPPIKKRIRLFQVNALFFHGFELKSELSNFKTLVMEEQISNILGFSI